MAITRVKKRNGKVVGYNRSKIKDAIWKAAQSVGGTDEHKAEMISYNVEAALESRFHGIMPSVEQINDIVEQTLIKEGHDETEMAFREYRLQHKKIREMRSSVMDTTELISQYVSGEDWRSAENANSSSITFAGLNARISGEGLERFALNEMYDGEIRKKHELGEIHIHDLSYPIVGYCAGWGIESLLKKGFGEVPGRAQSFPPKHLETVVLQMVNYIGTMQGEFAGAQAFSSVDTFLAPYVRRDNLTKKEVKQYLQMLVYGLNVPSRWGWQAPFSNLSFDLVVPEDLQKKDITVNLKAEDIEDILQKEKENMRDKYIGIMGEEDINDYIAKRKEVLTNMLDSTYEDYQQEMNIINEAFLELLEKGDKNGRPFTFPIPTYSITKDFDWESDIADKIFEVAGKTGAPYFQNYVGTGRDPKELRAMCCRLQLDEMEMAEHKRRSGGMWSMGDNTGSIGVVSINMNRLGYNMKGKSEEELYKALDNLMEIAKRSLEIKRDIVENGIEDGLVPYTKSYLGNFDNHFSTIGLVGMNEGLENYIGEGTYGEEGNALAGRILDYMVKKTKEFTKETGNLYNVEASPAESTAYRFAQKDKDLFGDDIYTSGDDVPFLTNSSMLPVDYTSNLADAIRKQEEVQSKYTGGTLFNIYLKEAISGESAKALMKTVVNTKIPYFSITPTFTVCPNHGRFNGEHTLCPDCGEEAEVYTRVTGYIRPKRSFNKGKIEEANKREEFNEKSYEKLEVANAV